MKPQAITATWYGIRCLTRREVQTAEELRKIGVTVELPRFRTLSRPSRKRESVETERPLIPGYLFAQVPLGAWYDIAETKGVCGWVSFQGKPHPCRPGQVESLLERVKLGEFDDAGIEGRIQPGDLLEILFGPFAGYQIAFQATKGNMLSGEVELLGAKRTVKVPRADVKLAR